MSHTRFRLIPAKKFLIKRPNWNTDVPSHQMYIMTGLKPCWSLIHNWLGISEIPVSQLEQTALGVRMCVTGSCPSNTAAGFFLPCTSEANHSLNLKTLCSQNLHSPDEAVPGLCSSISQYLFNDSRKIYCVSFHVLAEEYLRELALTPTLWIGWPCSTQLTLWLLWLQMSYKRLYRSRKPFLFLFFCSNMIIGVNFCSTNSAFVGIENAPVGFSNPSWERHPGAIN